MENALSTGVCSVGLPFADRNSGRGRHAPTPRRFSVGSTSSPASPSTRRSVPSETPTVVSPRPTTAGTDRRRWRCGPSAPCRRRDTRDGVKIRTHRTARPAERSPREVRRGRRSRPRGGLGGVYRGHPGGRPHVRPSVHSPEPGDRTLEAVGDGVFDGCSLPDRVLDQPRVVEKLAVGVEHRRLVVADGLPSLGYRLPCLVLRRLETGAFPLRAGPVRKGQRCLRAVSTPESGVQPAPASVLTTSRANSTWTGTQSPRFLSRFRVSTRDPGQPNSSARGSTVVFGSDRGFVR